MFLYLFRQTKMSFVIFRNHKQTACVLVDSVNDTGADNAAYSRKTSFAMKKKSIDKSVVGISRRRVNDHALRLVYNNKQIAVLIENIKRYVLRNNVGGLGIGIGYFKPVKKV